MGNLKNTTQKKLNKNHLPNLVLLEITKFKQGREREREREYSIFVWKKYGLIGINDFKFIQNKMGRRRVKIQERGNDEESLR